MDGNAWIVFQNLDQGSSISAILALGFIHSMQQSCYYGKVVKATSLINYIHVYFNIIHL